MKQTKLREPILYTYLCVVSIIIIIVIGNHKINIYMSVLLCFIFRGLLFISVLKWIYRDNTRDMKKYILGKIKEVDENIEELQEEKEELRKLIRQ